MTATRTLVRALAAAALLVLVAAIWVLPVLTCLALLRRLGVVAVPIVGAIALTWVLLAGPLLALAARLVRPQLRQSSPPRRHTTAAALLTDRARQDEWTTTPPDAPPPRHDERYGLRAPGLAAVAALAAVGSIATWFVATR